MKKYIILLGLLFVFITQSNAKQSPAFNEVVEEFIANYAVSNGYNDYEKLKFEKRKDGWWVYTEEYDKSNSGEIKILRKNRELFWNNKKSKFLILRNYRKDIKTSFRDKVGIYLNKNNYEWYNFERVPYYGYDGWYLDVINDFESKDNLSNILYEGLARAYSHYAKGFLWNQYDAYYYDKHSALRTPLKPVEIPNKERIEAYIQTENKAIACYKKIMDRDKNYATMVGLIDLKYFNEIMAVYLDLKICGEDESAKKLIDTCTIPEYVMKQAKNYFNSTLPNAIIFSNGDSDTYPLLYIQEKLGYRKDVSIINVNLLNLAWYASYISQSQPTLGKYIDLYKEPNVYFMYKEGDVKDTVSIDSLFAMEKHLVYESNIYAYNYNHVYIKTSSGSIPVKLNNYMLLGDMAMFDIIRTNISTHPIYFAGMHTENFSPQNIVQSGILFQLSDKIELDNTWADYQNNYIKNIFLYDTQIIDRSYLYNMYSRLCENVYDYYLKNDKTEKADDVLKQLVSVIEKVYPVVENNYTMANLATLLYEHAYNNIAIDIENKLLKNVKKQLQINNYIEHLAESDRYYLLMLKTAKEKLKLSTNKIDEVLQIIEKKK